MGILVFLRFARLRIRERMEYRGAYLLGIVAQIIGWGGDYAVIYLLLQRFHTINGWTWPQVVFLYSIDLFSYALGASFAFSAMVELEEMVVNGTFDIVLVQPIHPLLYLVARKYNVGYVAHIVIAGAFLAWAVKNLGVAWGGASVAFLVLSLLAAAAVQAAALIFIGAISFAVVRTGFAFSLYYRIKDFIAYPITLYGHGIQWLLSLALPLAFINFYPASFLLHKGGAVLPWQVGALTPLLGAGLLAAAIKTFGAGMSRYQGAGG